MRTLSAMSISVSGIVRESYLSILVLQIDKEIKKAINIVAVNDAKSILQYTLVKPIVPLNLSESEIIEMQKTSKSRINLQKNITH